MRISLALLCCVLAVSILSVPACGNDGPTPPSGTSTTSTIGGGGPGTTSSTSSSSTSTSTPTTTTSSSSTTTTIGEQAQRYIGTYTPAGGNQLPLDLSAFFNLPKGARYSAGFAFPRAIFDVTGGYNTGPGSFTGTIAGTLDGSVGNGIFTGVITANLGGCVASRNYTGPLTPAAFDWSGGSHLNTCGSSTPLTSGMNAPASNLPPTTTVPSTTTTSTQPQSTLVFTFTPNPVPTAGFTTRCSGGTTPQKTWEFTLRIQNTSTVPFTINFWARSIENQAIQDLTASEFAQTFGTSTIGPNSEARGTLCVWLTSASGQVRYFFNGQNGNGPHVTSFLQLLQ